MIEFIRSNQLDVMLFFSGVCAILIPLTWVTTTLSKRRKWLLTLIEAVSSLLLIRSSSIHGANLIIKYDTYPLFLGLF